MRWITREKPTIDRIACPWLIKRFVDPEAIFIYVPFEQVLTQASILDAIPFDIPVVEFTHYQDECTFDYILRKYKLTDPALQSMALMVRGADTDRHDLAPQASGLWSISAGLAYNYSDDLELLEKGMMLYDALYSWAKYLQKEKHTQAFVEIQLLEVLKKHLIEKKGTKKIPSWAKELREILQDHIDTHLGLREISKILDVHPAYLSREFSKYFDDLSFGEYIRKLRIEKATELIQSSGYSFTEIAYLTGFSDQSHFTRIFKLHTGKTPSVYRKTLSKSKKDTKG